MKSKIFLALFMAVTKLSAAAWYVSTTGNDANPDTFADTLLTLDKAIVQASPGDVIELRGGGNTSNVVPVHPRV